MVKTLILLLCIASLLSGAAGLRHRLDIRDDDRKLFKIETFGFLSGGQMSINIRNMVVSPPSGGSGRAYHRVMGFVMRKSKSESAAQADIEKIVESDVCLVDYLHRDDVFINMTSSDTWMSQSVQHTFESKGLYSFLFVRCADTIDVARATVSFHLSAEFYNPGPSYLSAGDAYLPIVYGLMFVAFTLATTLWLWTILYSDDRSVVNIHWMMLALACLKCVSLLLDSIRYHYIALNGSSELWSVLYFIFAALKGVMLFTVILLIGSGWSLMKAYLSDREKTIVWVVLCLQVVDNIAMVVLEETSPGTKVWLMWRDFLHFLDIACCCAILFPIVWSINHLQQAAKADGKTSINLKKLQLFREFYVIVIVYIYLTRIAVYLLSASIAFDELWIGDLASELSAFAFYVITGYKFRPSQDNPYLPVAAEELDVEYGLDEFDYEVDDRAVKSRLLHKSNGVEMTNKE